MRQSIIECLKICLADHQPHKLIDINHEIKSMGTWSRYDFCQCQLV